MKKLVFKKWYSKKNFGGDEIIFNVEKYNCILVGQTEKAIICEHCICTRNANSHKMFFPKSAVIVMEENDLEHYEEMNKIENKELALKEVNDYLLTINFGTKEDVKNMVADCRYGL